MAKNQTLDLGQLQANLQASTNTLRLAQRNKLRADQAFEEATAAHERSRAELNGAVSALKAATTVPNLYAQ